jgi:hypothetical protein
VTRDGLSRHFFHRPSKAYTTGTRKRRKIQTEECDLQGTSSGGETRWHKTGKTRPVMVNGKQKGCKKILVLYTNFGKNRKPEKTNWVMHQYHLGQHEEEKEGELVVSKIFYQTQPRQCNWSENNNNNHRIGATTTITGEGSGGGEPSNNNYGRRDSGSGSSSSKEIVTHNHSHGHIHRDEMSAVVGVNPLTSFTNALDIQHLKSDHFGFLPFRKSSFDEVRYIYYLVQTFQIEVVSSVTIYVSDTNTLFFHSNYYQCRRCVNIILNVYMYVFHINLIHASLNSLHFKIIIAWMLKLRD